MLQFLETLIREYGYAALFIGTFLEGETILLLAGFLAHNGQLNLAMCILVAFCGSLAGDQTAFYLGRWKGKEFIDKRPALQCRVERVHRMLDRFHEVLIVSFRFFYGLRNLTPLILGATNINALKFFFLNAIGAAAWAVVFAYAGYFFSVLVVDSLLKDVKHVQIIVLLIVVAALSILWVVKRHRRRKLRRLRLARRKAQGTPNDTGDNCPR